MIKRETIKQAIDAIRARDPEIGYALDEMLGMGMIDAPDPGGETTLDNDFFFYFDHRKARVSRFVYISKGTVPIEERLLIKYGEYRKKHELMERGEAVDFPEAVRMIRMAGLDLMVDHEIDYAVSRVKAMPQAETGPGAKDREELIGFLGRMRTDDRPLPADPRKNSPPVLFHGALDPSPTAYFMRFPYCRQSLIQVADINIEFFHVRFLLNRLIQSHSRNLFVCLVDGRIMGLIYLTFKEHLFFRSLEIKFISTVRGRKSPLSDPERPPPRGVGSFLVAGVWLLWKGGALKARDMTLDSEVEARGFYQTVGFESRGMSEFVLTNPRGGLLKSILDMYGRSNSPDPGITKDAAALVEKQVKSLRGKAKTEKELSERKAAVAAVREALASCHQEIRETAVKRLAKHRKKIPEAEELLRLSLFSLLKC